MTEEEKQDCELAAAYRLLKKIKKAYPQLKICLLADGLYANDPIIKLCKDFKWRYIIVLKRKRLKQVYREFESLQKLEPENKKEFEDEEVKQTFRWSNQIDYKEQWSDKDFEPIKKSFDSLFLELGWQEQDDG